MPPNTNYSYAYAVFESLILPVFLLCDNIAVQALAEELPEADRAIYQDIHNKLTTYITNARSAASTKGARPAVVVPGPDGQASTPHILPIGSFSGSTDIQYPLTLFTLPVVTEASRDDIDRPFVVFTPQRIGMQYDQLRDVNARNHRAEPVYEREVYYGQLQNIFVVTLPENQYLGLERRTTY